MIKPEELRLGNLIINPDGIILEITNITPFLDERYAGIPLTEEWLLKAGFTVRFTKISGRINYWNKEKDASVDFDPFDKTFHYTIKDGKSGNIYKHIIYVHQLQNLHFALKGEELEFNLQ